jgi:hypothetical protein
VVERDVGQRRDADVESTHVRDQLRELDVGDVVIAISGES